MPTTRHRQALADRLRRPRLDQGFTLTEVMVVMAILGVVLLIFTSVLWSVQKSLTRESARSDVNDQTRLALEDIDREVRSANYFYDPAAEIPSGMSFRIYTQAYADSDIPGNLCVQWQLLNQKLWRRDWATNWIDDPSTLVSPWRLLATPVLNQTLSPQVKVFTLDTSQLQYGSRIVKVDLIVNESTTSASNTEIDVSVEGRNTEYGYPNTACNSIPPGTPPP